MGFRFHKVLSVIPGLRINVSKSGVSTSVGPRGADVNIGRHGVTTNASLPGTGISYRSKVGGHGSKLGILAVVAALGFAAYKNSDRITSLFQHPPKTIAAAATALTASKSQVAAQNIANDATPSTGVRYIHRSGSVLREAPASSAKVLKKEDKGTKLDLISVSGPWAQVRDGSTTGWMRSSVLGNDPPQ